MDIQGPSGKPEMSRELVERLSHAIDSGRQQFGVVAGDTRAPDMNVRRNVYRSSHLGSGHGIRQMGNELGTPRRHPHHRDGTPTPERLATDQNRPSAGFKEPSPRGYNPYG